MWNTRVGRFMARINPLSQKSHGYLQVQRQKGMLDSQIPSHRKIIWKRGAMFPAALYVLAVVTLFLWSFLDGFLFTKHHPYKYIIYPSISPWTKEVHGLKKTKTTPGRHHGKVEQPRQQRRQSEGDFDKIAGGARVLRRPAAGLEIDFRNTSKLLDSVKKKNPSAKITTN